MKRELGKLKHLYAKDAADIHGIGRTLNSYRAHLSHGHTYRLRKNIWSNFILTKQPKGEKENE